MISIQGFILGDSQRWHLYNWALNLPFFALATDLVVSSKPIDRSVLKKNIVKQNVRMRHILLLSLWKYYSIQLKRTKKTFIIAFYNYKNNKKFIVNYCFIYFSYCQNCIYNIFVFANFSDPFVLIETLGF
jgi:hypothetical protein